MNTPQKIFAVLSVAAFTMIISADDYTGTQQLFYSPAGAYCGDPFPYFNPVAGDFKILYLQDYRPNPPYTFHPVWCADTPDALSYTAARELIPCGDASSNDAAIGTGSTILHDGIYHTFFTAHNRRGESVMVATSPDFVKWTKDSIFELDGAGKYDKRDYRDPCVITDENGKYHLFISTRLDGQGVIADYVSADLRNWIDNGVFLTMREGRFYECPDLFRMGEWWYLIFSEQNNDVRRLQYLKGRTRDELKSARHDDNGNSLDGRGLYAGKTASNGRNRYLWGWCGTRRNGFNCNAYEWAGNLVAHRIVRHPDGSLSLGEIPGIPDTMPEVSSIPDFTVAEGQTRRFLPLSGMDRISCSVHSDSCFGLSLCRDDAVNDYYSIIIHPEDGDMRKINFEHRVDDIHYYLDHSDSPLFPVPADGNYDITLVIDHSVLVLYINDNVAYTNRCYGMTGNGWSIDAYEGDITVTGIEIRTPPTHSSLAKR